MIDHALESVLCQVLQEQSDLAGVAFFPALHEGDHTLPAITILSKSAALSGSVEVFTSDVEIHVESHAQDSTAAEHAARAARILALLGARENFVSAVNAQSALRLGCVMLTN